jgi:hypothetical protein
MSKLVAHAKQRIMDDLSLTEMCLEFTMETGKWDLGELEVSYHLSTEQWVRYIFPFSKELQDRYADRYGESKLVKFIREDQLDELQIDNDLLHLALECWIADLDDFTSEAQQRLGQFFEANGAPPLMSAFYFTIPKAKYLAKFLVPGKTQTTLEAFLVKVAETYYGEEKNGVIINQALASLLSSHLKKMFNIKSGLHEPDSHDLSKQILELWECRNMQHT